MKRTDERVVETIKKIRSKAEGKIEEALELVEYGEVKFSQCISNAQKIEDIEYIIDNFLFFEKAITDLSKNQEEFKRMLFIYPSWVKNSTEKKRFWLIEKAQDCYTENDNLSFKILWKVIGQYIEINLARFYFNNHDCRETIDNEDVKQFSQMYCWQALPQYDLYKTAPITYFKQCGIFAIRGVVMKDTYADQIIQRITKVIRLEQNEGSQKELSDYSDAELSELINYYYPTKNNRRVTAKTVANTRKKMLAKIDSLSTSTSDGNSDSNELTLQDKISSKVPSPEQAMLEKESTQVFSKVFDKLSIFEKDVLYLRFGFNINDYNNRYWTNENCKTLSDLSLAKFLFNNEKEFLRDYCRQNLQNSSNYEFLLETLNNKNDEGIYESDMLFKNNEEYRKLVLYILQKEEFYIAQKFFAENKMRNNKMTAIGFETCRNILENLPEWYRMEKYGFSDITIDKAQKTCSEAMSKIKKMLKNEGYGKEAKKRISNSSCEGLNFLNGNISFSKEVFLQL